MYRLLITKEGKRFEDPTEEAERKVSFGIVWSNGSDQKDKVLSPYCWTIQPYFGPKGHSLRDLQGEVRPISWGGYCSAIEYPDWSAYDKAQTDVALEKAQKDIVNLQEQIDLRSDEQQDLCEKLTKCRNTLEIIYDINATGGPGSRAKVRHFLLESGISPCENCGHASCTCEH